MRWTCPCSGQRTVCQGKQPGAGKGSGAVKNMVWCCSGELTRVTQSRADLCQAGVKAKCAQAEVQSVHEWNGPLCKNKALQLARLHRGQVHKQQARLCVFAYLACKNAPIHTQTPHKHTCIRPASRSLLARATLAGSSMVRAAGSVAGADAEPGPSSDSSASKAVQEALGLAGSYRPLARSTLPLRSSIRAQSAGWHCKQTHTHMNTN